MSSKWGIQLALKKVGCSNLNIIINGDYNNVIATKKDHICRKVSQEGKAENVIVYGLNLNSEFVYGLRADTVNGHNNP